MSARNSRTRNIGVAALVLAVFVVLSSEAAAQDLGPGNTLEFLPRGDLYKPYIADPLYRVTFSLQYIQMIHNGIPATGSSRYGLQAGGRFGLLRSIPNDHPELGWQLSIEGGIDSLYDRGSNDDNIGYNGKFGAYLTTARENGWSYKLAVLHTSSHLGDEYIQNTGRQRIDYTREEVAVGVSKDFLSHYRVYGETGWGFLPGNAEGEKPGRFEAGFEIEYPNVFWNDLLGWYAAADFSSWQERDWKLNAALQTGVYLPVKERRYRMGIEVYRGRSTMGEFFQNMEEQFVFGFWINI